MSLRLIGTHLILEIKLLAVTTNVKPKYVWMFKSCLNRFWHHNAVRCYEHVLILRFCQTTIPSEKYVVSSNWRTSSASSAWSFCIRTWSMPSPKVEQLHLFEETGTLGMEAKDHRVLPLRSRKACIYAMCTCDVEATSYPQHTLTSIIAQLHSVILWFQHLLAMLFSSENRYTRSCDITTRPWRPNELEAYFASKSSN